MEILAIIAIKLTIHSLINLIMKRRETNIRHTSQNVGHLLKNVGHLQKDVLINTQY